MLALNTTILTLYCLVHLALCFRFCHLVLIFFFCLFTFLHLLCGFIMLNSFFCKFCVYYLFHRNKTLWYTDLMSVVMSDLYAVVKSFLRKKSIFTNLTISHVLSSPGHISNRCLHFYVVFDVYNTTMLSVLWPPHDLGGSIPS